MKKLNSLFTKDELETIAKTGMSQAQMMLERACDTRDNKKLLANMSVLKVIAIHIIAQNIASHMTTENRKYENVAPQYIDNIRSESFNLYKFMKDNPDSCVDIDLTDQKKG